MILKWSQYFRVGLNIGEMKNPKQITKRQREQPIRKQEKCTWWVPLDRSLFLDLFMWLRKENKKTQYYKTING